MRFVPLFIFCLMCSWCTLTPAEAQLPWDRQLPQVPEVKAQMVGPALAAGASGPTTLRIAVEIPPDHHGYLDAGNDGVLIPLAFAFPALVERGVQVVMLSHPTGIHDAKVRATVFEASRDVGGRMHSDTRNYWRDGQVSEWCGEFINTDHKTMRGLAQRFQALDPLDREAVQNGFPRVGMSTEALRFVWGEPYYTDGNARRSAHWHYLGSSLALGASGNQYNNFGSRVDVYLTDGKVVGWVDGASPNDDKGESGCSPPC